MQAHLSVHFWAFVPQTVKCRLLVLTLPVLRYITSVKLHFIITLAPSEDASPTAAIVALAFAVVERDSLVGGDRVLNRTSTI